MSAKKFNPKVNKVKANDYQIGGDHYKSGIQPWDALREWFGLGEAWHGFMIGTAIVYLARAHRKNGIEDVRKALHFLEKYLEEAG